MKEPKLYQLFEAAKTGSEAGFAALGKTISATTNVIEILELARFMAARNGYPDTHTILDKWIEKLEEKAYENHEAELIEEPAIDRFTGLSEVEGLDEEELHDNPAIDQFVRLLGRQYNEKNQNVRPILRRVPIQEIWNAVKALNLLSEKATIQWDGEKDIDIELEAHIYLHEWTAEFRTYTQEDYELDHPDDIVDYEDIREPWWGDQYDD